MDGGRATTTTNAGANGVHSSKKSNGNLHAHYFVMACPNQKRRSENIPVTIVTMMQRIRFSFFPCPNFVSIHDANNWWQNASGL